MSRVSILFALASCVACSAISAAPVQAETPAHHVRQPRVERPSHFYIKGPNAPYKNQIRKMTDPLNANGAGR